MNEYKALLQSVLDAPDDDLPRSVLADWLEDNGYEARAATIRWGLANPKEHCIGGIWKNFEWSKWPGSEVHGFVSTSASFVQRHLNAAGWRDSPYVNFHPRDVTYVIRRGFIDEIRAPLGELMCYGPRIARRHPLRLAVLSGGPTISSLGSVRFDEATRNYLLSDRGYVVNVSEFQSYTMRHCGDLNLKINDLILKAILGDRSPVIGPRVWRRIAPAWPPAWPHATEVNAQWLNILNGFMSQAPPPLNRGFLTGPTSASEPPAPGDAAPPSCKDSDAAHPPG